MKKTLALALSTIILSACLGDGVPKVDDPLRPKSAEGVEMTPEAFIDKYCTGKPNNETCIKVNKAMVMGRGTFKNGW